MLVVYPPRLCRCYSVVVVVVVVVVAAGVVRVRVKSESKWYSSSSSSSSSTSTPTKMHGLVEVLFNKMWEEESLSRHFPTYKEFDLVATTIRTVYNETAKAAGLTTRMVKFIPQRPGVEPPKRMRIDHDMGGKTSPQPLPKPSTQPSSSSKRPQQVARMESARERRRHCPLPHRTTDRPQQTGLAVAIRAMAGLFG